MKNNRLIFEPVGNNLKNRQDDVTRVKFALNRLGMFDEDDMHGYVTHSMDRSLKNLQKDAKLRIDGLMYPNGETETEILRRLVDSGAEVPSVKGEKLDPPPWPNIPGTNIPDFGVPEQGYSGSKIYDPYRNDFEGKRFILRTIRPPEIDPNMELPHNPDHDFVKRKWYEI